MEFVKEKSYSVGPFPELLDWMSLFISEYLAGQKFLGTHFETCLSPTAKTGNRRATPGPTPVFVNKVLLKQHNACSLKHCL